MMKLSAMRAVCETILPAGRCPVAEHVLAPWEHDAGSDRFIVASSNFTASFTYNGERRIVRFVKADERSRDAIQAELDFLRHVAGNGIWVNLPIASREGRLVEHISTSLGDYHAVVFNAMAGEPRDSQTLTPDLYEPWGRTLAELHNASNGYHDPRRPSWGDRLDQAGQELASDDHAAHAALRKLRTALEALPATDRTYGLIHWDFCADNIRWGVGRLGVIDFANPLLSSFVRGYRSARTLEEIELSRLPLFMLMSNLLFYASLRIIMEEGREGSEPEWVKGLRMKLLGKIEKYRNELEQWIRRGVSREERAI